MKFSKNYSKLSKAYFTTIRKNTGMYKKGKIYKINTPNEYFYVKVICKTPIKKEDITEDLSIRDADCSKSELIGMLEKWYGKKFNDFVLIEMIRESVSGL